MGLSEIIRIAIQIHLTPYMEDPLVNHSLPFEGNVNTNEIEKDDNDYVVKDMAFCVHCFPLRLGN